MPPEKRRKVERPAGMSAFAARKSLLGPSSSTQPLKREETSAAEWSDDSLSSLDEWNNKGANLEIANDPASALSEIPAPTTINFIFPSKNQIHKVGPGLEIRILGGEVGALIFFRAFLSIYLLHLNIFFIPAD